MDYHYYWKCNFPSTLSIVASVYRSVGRSIIISLKGGKLHFHAPIGALFNIKIFTFNHRILVTRNEEREGRTLD